MTLWRINEISRLCWRDQTQAPSSVLFAMLLVCRKSILNMYPCISMIKFKQMKETHPDSQQVVDYLDFVVPK